MKDFQKIGGIAALIEAATFIFGFVLAFTVLEPYITGELNPGETVAFLADNQTIMYIWNMVIYVVFGIFLVVLAMALNERLKNGPSGLVKTATAFGLIWAGLVIASGMVFNIGSVDVVDLYGSDPVLAGTVWLAIASVLNGLGGGNEIVGGVWVLLVSWAALRGGGLPKALNYFGIVIAVAGILTVIPAFGEIGGIIFGLGTIVWFAWLGIAMLRSSPDLTG